MIASFLFCRGLLEAAVIFRVRNSRSTFGARSEVVGVVNLAALHT